MFKNALIKKVILEGWMSNLHESFHNGQAVFALVLTAVSRHLDQYIIAGFSPRWISSDPTLSVTLGARGFPPKKV